MSPIYKSDTGRSRVEESYRAFLQRWPVPADFVTVPTREGDTFIVVSGPETAPPLVLLHGSTGNATTWIGDIAAYAQHFRCYAVDIVGEPGLSAPSRPDMRSDALLLWLDDVLAGLGLDRVSLVGLSLGGWLALRYGAARPDRIVALAAISPAGIGRQRNFLLKFLPYLFLGTWGRRRIQQMIAGDMLGEPTPEAEAFQAFLFLIATQFRPRNDILLRLSDDQVRNLRFPVLAVVGGRDVMLNQEETRDRLDALAPDAIVDYRAKALHYIAETPARIVPFLLEANGAAL